MYVRKKTNDKKSCDESNEANILINGNLYRVNIARESATYKYYNRNHISGYWED